MPLVNDFEKLLETTKDMEAKRPNLYRLKRMLDEKRQKGIVPKKTSKIPTIQETERYGYETFFGTRA